jgi:hypothetical protein
MRAAVGPPIILWSTLSIQKVPTPHQSIQASSNDVHSLLLTLLCAVEFCHI